MAAVIALGSASAVLADGDGAHESSLTGRQSGENGQPLTEQAQTDRAGTSEASLTPLVTPDRDVYTIPLLAEAGPFPAITAESPRRIPVGAFCPARRADPLREASTFGASALLMWALARRRVARAEA